MPNPSKSPNLEQQYLYHSPQTNRFPLPVLWQKLIESHAQHGRTHTHSMHTHTHARTHTHTYTHVPLRFDILREVGRTRTPSMQDLATQTLEALKEAEATVAAAAGSGVDAIS